MPRPNLLNLTLAGLDELDHFPSPAERQAAIDAFPSSIRRRDIAVGVVLLIAVAVAVNISVRILVWNALPGRFTRFAPEVALVAMLTTAFFFIRWGHQRTAQRWLRSRLLACGVPVCTACGYNLQALPPSTTRCPECGAAIPPEAARILQHPTPTPPTS